MSTQIRERSHIRFGAWLAGALAALLAIGSLAVPAAAAGEGGFVEVYPLVGSGQYNGGSVLNSAGEYTLEIGYGRQPDGAVVVVDVPDGVTIPDSALVLPDNSGISKLSLDADKNLVITFENPFPQAIEQGYLGLKIKVTKVEKSEVRDLVWKVNSKETTQRVVIVKDGDTPTATNDYFDKSADSDSFPATVVNGQVVLDSALLGKKITYTLAVNSKDARTANLTDTLDAGLVYVDDSFTGTKIVRDGNDVNPVTTTLTGLPKISGTTFTYALAVEANSRYTFTYAARIAGQSALDALRTQLQAEYDKVKANPDGASYRVGLSNTASFGASIDTATRFVGGSVAAEARPNTGNAFAKSVDVAAVGADAPAVDVATSTTGALRTPIPVTYTLKADLTQWNDFADSRYKLTRNVVIRDALPTGTDWVGTDAGLTVTDQAGKTWAFTPAKGLGSNVEVDIATDTNVGTYAFNDKKELYLNVGRDTSKTYTITAKAQIVSVAGLKSGETPLTTRFAVTNTAYFVFKDRKSVV